MGFTPAATTRTTTSSLTRVGRGTSARCSSSASPVRSITSACIVPVIGTSSPSASPRTTMLHTVRRGADGCGGEGNSGEATVRGVAGARGGGDHRRDRGPVRAELVDGAEPTGVRRELLQLLHDPVERAGGDRAAHRCVVRLHAARRSVLVQPRPRLRGDLHGHDARRLQPAAARGVARPGDDGAVVERDPARLGAALPRGRLGARARAVVTSSGAASGPSRSSRSRGRSTR